VNILKSNGTAYLAGVYVLIEKSLDTPDRLEAAPAIF